MLPVLLLLLILTEPGHAETESQADRKYNALKFGNTLEDNIMFKPDMQPGQQALSVCAWVKKLWSGGSIATWFSYATRTYSHEILITDDGLYNYILHNNLNLRGKMSPTVGIWYHYCLTWGLGAHTKKVYFNGEMVGSESTTSRQLGLDGYLNIGNEQDSYGGGLDAVDAFGGELFKLNVFSNELTAIEVKEMTDGGLCSEVEEEYGRARFLKWEDILLVERGDANVTEIDAGCPQSEETEETEEECDCPDQQNVTYSRWDILYTEQFYNSTMDQDTLHSLCSLWNHLGPFFGSTINDEFIRHFKEFHEGHACDE